MRLGGVGKEGEVDVGHLLMLALERRRRSRLEPVTGRARRRAFPGRRDPARRRLGAVAVAGRVAAARLVGERDVGERDERLAAQHPRQVLARRRTGVAGDLLGRALGDDPAAAVAALGPEVDDPVGGLDDVEVVLDDEDRVAAVDQAMEDLEQLLDVGEVEPGRRLVEDVQGPAGRPPRQLGRRA